jgi:serine protease
MRATVLLLVLLVATVGSAAKKPTACTGRFGLDRSLVTGLPGTEVIDITRRRVTLGSCGTAKARLHVGRHVTRLQAVFAHCPGIRGKARLTARIAAPACVTLEGTFRARRAGISTAFTAAFGGTVSGHLAVPGTAIADADTADAAMQGNNDTAASAQLLPGIATVGGAAGPNDGTLESGSWRLSDFYRIDLDGRPRTILLTIANPELVDLDLFLLDPSGTAILPASIGTANVERIDTTTETGPAFVVVATYLPSSAGTTAYVLGVGQSASTADVPPDAEIVPGEMLVRFRDSVPLVATGRLAVAHQDARWISGDTRDRGGALFRLPEGFAKTPDDARAATLAAVEATRRRADVLWAEPNYVRHPSLVPNDPLYEFQWHYPLIALPEAWAATTGSPDVIVAVVDTGVLFGHPDLDPARFVPGFDFISSAARARDGDGIDPDPFDAGDGGAGGTSSFHGTHVAGTIGAASNNGVGVSGVDWNAKVMPIRVLGLRGGADADIAQGIRFAAGLPNDSGTVPARRADVINLSLGGRGVSQALREAVQAARAAGVIVVAAAGNENEDAGGSSPASFPEVVCVSAVDLRTRKAPYSNFGAVVDVAAPGGDTGVDRDGDGYVDGVLSTLGDDSGGGRTRPIYKFYQGTSMAAPHVAGVAALMQAAYLAATGGARLSPDGFDALLAAGALTDSLGSDGFSGFGLINASKAVSAAGGAAAPGPPSLSAVPGSINIGADLGEASVLLRNGGSGTLTVQAVTLGPDTPWLTVLPSVALPAPVPLTLRLVPTRAGLAPATYTGTVVVETSAGNSTIPVALAVSAGSTSGDVGHVFVLLVDPQSREPVAQADSLAASGYPVDFGGVVPGGEFLLVAGTDRDDDGVIGDPGEAFGAYPTVDSPVAIDVPFGGELTVDLPVLEQVAIAASADEPGLQPLPAEYHRLR